MEFNYCVHYHDERLVMKYQSVSIRTGNINKWIEKFTKDNKPYITVMEYELSR